MSGSFEPKLKILRQSPQKSHDLYLSQNQNQNRSQSETVVFDGILTVFMLLVLETLNAL
jgi:hypothetical protein